jgi:hypothetical protein
MYVYAYVYMYMYMYAYMHVYAYMYVQPALRRSRRAAGESPESTAEKSSVNESGTKRKVNTSSAPPSPERRQLGFGSEIIAVTTPLKDGNMARMRRRRTDSFRSADDVDLDEDVEVVDADVIDKDKTD